MAPSSSTKKKKTMQQVASSWATIAEAALWYSSFVILALILMSSIRVEDNYLDDDHTAVIRGNQLHLINNRPCDEIYVVGEGETLHTISDKCGDPYIVERNPHIHDPDDVFPGLVIRIITPSTRPTELFR